MHGLKTLAQIVSVYAPPNENNTAAYVKSVADYCAANASEDYNVFDGGKLAALVAAIVRHENGPCPYGQWVPGETIQAAVREALA